MCRLSTMDAVSESLFHQLARCNGQKYLQNRRTMVLGLSPGNPHYYKGETLQKLFYLAERNSDKVLLFVPDKISEHNYRAIGSKNPEKSARVKAKRLRNKCKEVMKCIDCSTDKYSYINWAEHIDSNPEYLQAFDKVIDLYQKNVDFRYEIQQATQAALVSMKTSRENGIVDDQTQGGADVDVEEGVKYLLKELAFFDVLPNIYENCTEYVVVYHRSWPVLEKYCEGFYDGLLRPFLGFLVFHE